MPGSKTTETNHIHDIGLGPIGYYCCGSTVASISEDDVKELKGADLAARVIYAQLRSATIQILDVADQHKIPVILLKGISVAEDIYIQPHHRLMGDIDLLVPKDQAGQLRDLLIGCGYSSKVDEPESVHPIDHHHLPTLRHGKTGIAVELHTSLFSATEYSNSPIFDTANTWLHSRQESFHGQLCRRLSHEFQFAYTVAHWSVDHGWTTNVTSINDVCLILSKYGKVMDWTLIESWYARCPMLADSASVLLLSLNRTAIVQTPKAARNHVRSSVQHIGAANVAVLCWLIDLFPFSGRKKVAWFLTESNARIIWGTLLERRNRYLKVFLAAKRIVFRRVHGKPILVSTANRIRTLIRPNY